MTVYIEYVIIDNLAIDCLLLYLTALALKLNFRVWRLALAGLVGVGLALVFPYITENVLTVVLKVVACPLLPVVAFAPLPWKKCIFAVLTFGLFTVTLGGLVLMILLYNVSFTLSKVAIYYMSCVPVGAYVIGAGLLLFAARSLVRFVNKAKSVFPYERKAELTLCGRKYRLNAMYDSGNKLKHDGLPVCFLTDRHLITKYKDDLAQRIVNGDRSIRSLTVATVSGQQDCLGYVDKLTCQGKEYEIILCASATKQEDCQLLLNGEIDGGIDETA